MATAEFAVALPALLLMLGFSLGAVDATLAKLRCVDAAREAALAAARGDNGVASASTDAPVGATVVVRVDGDVVRAVVTVHTQPLGAHLPGVTVSGTAAAMLEPGVTDAG